MTDNLKIQAIRDLPSRLVRKWNALRPEAKREVLDAMDISTSVAWIGEVMEEVRNETDRNDNSSANGYALFL